jgi:hypothetical protein
MNKSQNVLNLIDEMQGYLRPLLYKQDPEKTMGWQLSKPGKGMMSSPVVQSDVGLPPGEQRRLIPKSWGNWGNRVELVVIDATKSLHLALQENTERGGPVWDMRPQGPGWVGALVNNFVNIKTYNTRWMFGRKDLARYLNVEIGTSDRNLRRISAEIKKTLDATAFPFTTFLKMADAKVESDLWKKYRDEDVHGIANILKDARFYIAPAVGSSYTVKLSIANDGTLSNIDLVTPRGLVFGRGHVDARSGRVHFSHPSTNWVALGYRRSSIVRVR